MGKDSNDQNAEDLLRVVGGHRRVAGRPNPSDPTEKLGEVRFHQKAPETYPGRVAPPPVLFAAVRREIVKVFKGRCRLPVYYRNPD